MKFVLNEKEIIKACKKYLDEIHNVWYIDNDDVSVNTEIKEQKPLQIEINVNYKV